MHLPYPIKLTKDTTRKLISYTVYSICIHNIIYSALQKWYHIYTQWYHNRGTTYLMDLGLAEKSEGELTSFRFKLICRYESQSVEVRKSIEFRQFQRFQAILY